MFHGHDEVPCLPNTDTDDDTEQVFRSASWRGHGQSFPFDAVKFLLRKYQRMGR
jgi:hypothetical protein